MRAIKFRGANREEGWVYGNLILGRKEYRGENLDKPVYAYIARFKDNGEVFPIEPVRVAPSTVGQFTGLYDKNGKEIYEGDIVIMSGSNRHYVVQKDEGVFSIYALFYRTEGNSRLQIADFLKRCFSDPYEIIGNIFDNPELL